MNIYNCLILDFPDDILSETDNTVAEITTACTLGKTLDPVTCVDNLLLLSGKCAPDYPVPCYSALWVIRLDS
jgi:hypothetical protein